MSSTPSNPLIYPYGIRLTDSGRTETFPMIKVGVSSAEGNKVFLRCLVDSGATFTAISKPEADMLGIDIKSGTPTVVGGVGTQPVHGWMHTIAIEISNISLSIPCIVLDREDAPCILGRSGVFDGFTIVFEESRKRKCSRFFTPETHLYLL